LYARAKLKIFAKNICRKTLLPHDPNMQAQPNSDYQTDNHREIIKVMFDLILYRRNILVAQSRSGER